MREHFQFFAKGVQVGENESELLAKLSPELEEEARVELMTNMFRSCHFFRCIDREFVRENEIWLERILFARGETIIHAGEQGSELYIVESGEVAIFDEFGTFMTMLSEGAVSSDHILFLILHVW